MHQFKINGKMAFDGDVWQWHQDFGTWFNDDQMPEARAMNVAIFLDEVNEFNGPLMFIPAATSSACSTPGTTPRRPAIPLWTIDHATITQADRARRPAWRPKGRAGSMIMFHSCLVHASTSNLSPWNRVSVYLSLCAVSNHIRPLQAAGVHRPPRLHADRVPAGRLPAAPVRRGAAVEGRHAGGGAQVVRRGFSFSKRAALSPRIFARSPSFKNVQPSTNPRGSYQPMSYGIVRADDDVVGAPEVHQVRAAARGRTRSCRSRAWRATGAAFS